MWGRSKGWLFPSYREGHISSRQVQNLLDGIASRAGLQDSSFNDTAAFTSAKFDKEASFDDTQFAGTTSFNNSRFKDDALFENTTFKDVLYLTRTKYDKFYIKLPFKKGLGYESVSANLYKYLVKSEQKV